MSDKDQLLVELSEKVLKKFQDNGYDALSEPEQVFLCVWKLNGEINNGGFDQFYFNEFGEFAMETIFALERIGALDTADIVSRANAVFPAGYPSKNQDERQKDLQGLDAGDESLIKLDEEFYKEKDDLSALLYTYAVESGLNFQL